MDCEAWLSRGSRNHSTADSMLAKADFNHIKRGGGGWWCLACLIERRHGKLDLPMRVNHQGMQMIAKAESASRREADCG